VKKLNIPKQINIKEVGPRDGLQNESVVIPTHVKLEWINKLMDAGATYIELTSFVSPKWIPALADHAVLAQQYTRRAGVTTAALVPNMKGLERALQVDIDEISVFMSASETHNLKNINKSIAATMPLLKEVIEHALASRKTVRAYVSTVFGCPYEGRIEQQQVCRIIDQLLEYGAQEISLGDTIGIATPIQVHQLMSDLLQRYTADQLALHFHDTYGRGLANVMAAMQLGLTTFDSSAGGLGGCPYAYGAAGNIATEDLVDLCHSQGIETGIDLNAYCEASLFIQSYLHKRLPSRYVQAYED